MNNPFSSSSLTAACLLLIACSGTDAPNSGQQPGPAVGGSTSSNSGGSASATGGGQSGGTASAGGASPTGGNHAAGGASATGGDSASGGAPAAGGEAATGGSLATGGEPATGGTLATGGESAVGGSTQDCPSEALAPGNTTKTIEVNGESREYVLHVPDAYDGSEAVPLVVDFHPLGGSGPAEQTGSPYPAQTDSEGVIMAFPSGKSGPMGGAWNVGPCCVADVDDEAFARALVADIQESACIDPKRIYAVGFSMGGGMTHYLGCHAADLFAAVAPAAFDLLEENVDDCNPSRPLTVVAFRGTSDPIVSYDGGYSDVVSGMAITFLGAQGTFEKWAELNECTGSPSAEDGGGCSTYSTCKDGTEVTLCTKQGGGHEAGDAAYAWPILKQHTLP